MVNKKIIVQGYPGCFHEEAARKYFDQQELAIVSAHTFSDLADHLVSHPTDHLAIIAIENSIAGSLLQNYKIIRERHLKVIGEVYLRIAHNLMCLPGQTIDDIVEVHSHPMALNQCLDFFKQYPHIRLVEAVDTALSAKNIVENNIENVAAIASTAAADIYNLQIIASGIESSSENYTRFFIVQDSTAAIRLGDFNKASIYLRLQNNRGSLMRALQCIYDHKINLSKIQSYPVLGEVNSYYFHLDIEFNDLDNYEDCIDQLVKLTSMLEIIGVYNKSDVYDHTTV